MKVTWRELLRALILGACWEYTFLCHISEFLSLSRSDKLIDFGLFIPFFTLICWGVIRLIVQITGPIPPKMQWMGRAVAAVVAVLMLGVTGYHIPDFPQKHLLEILVKENQTETVQGKQVRFISLYRISAETQEREQITTDQMMMDGSWQEAEDGGFIVEQPPASIRFAESYSGPLEIVFGSDSLAGEVVIHYDGSEIQTNLWSAEANQRSIILENAVNFSRLDWIWRLMIGGLYLAAWISAATMCWAVIAILHSLYRLRLERRLTASLFYPLLMVLGITINLMLFAKIEQDNRERLRRLPDNTLLTLDEHSHDNVKRMQVYAFLLDNYSGIDLVITAQLLEDLGLHTDRLLTWSGVKSVRLELGHGQISETESDLLLMRSYRRVVVQMNNSQKTDFFFVLDNPTGVHTYIMAQSGERIFFYPDESAVP